MNLPTLEAALTDIAGNLRERNRRVALVGGLAVSLRSVVRFTRDVDLAVLVSCAGDFETLVFDLRSDGYKVAASLEHEGRRRRSTVRLESPSGFAVDLLAASCGIESEIIQCATMVAMDPVGPLPASRAEELLAMKVLAAAPQRLQDRIDARNLLLFCESLNFDDVRDNLQLMTERGFNRGQDLSEKLARVIAETKDECNSSDGRLEVFCSSSRSPALARLS
jgi:hypothetical protein